MAVEKLVLNQGFTAASAMSAASQQFCFVELVGSMSVALCDATTDQPIGVLQNSPAINELADVCMLGISKVRVGGSDVSAGNLLAVGADGRAIALTSGTSTGFYPVGKVLSVDAADNDGALVTAYINCNLSRNG